MTMDSGRAENAEKERFSLNSNVGKGFGMARAEFNTHDPVKHVPGHLATAIQGMTQKDSGLARSAKISSLILIIIRIPAMAKNSFKDIANSVMGKGKGCSHQKKQEIDRLSASTGYPLRFMTRCLNLRMVDVQSAVKKTHTVSHWPLTTIIKREVFAVYFASLAMSASGISETMLTSCV